MQIEFISIGIRTQRTVAVILLLGVLWFLFLSIRDFRAQSWMTSSDLKDIQKSAAIEPRNADVWFLTGHTQLFELQDLDAAFKALKRATALNPHDSRYWIDLAVAERLRGNLSGERAAMARALDVDPMTPDVAWQAANLAFTNGDILGALHRFRNVVQFDPERSVQALDLCWRNTGDLALLLHNAMPATSDAYSAMLAVLLQDGRLDVIGPLWDAAKENHIVIPSSMAATVANSLLLSKRAPLAARIWSDLGAADPNYHDYLPTEHNLMVNAGFESDFINIGFDWHVAPTSGVKFEIDTQAHSENRSVRMEFANSIPADLGMTQYVLVEPGRIYRIGLFAKSENLMTASKPLLIIEDAETGERLYRSNEIENFSFWKEYAGTFQAPLKTHLLRIHLVREPSNLLIAGKLWLDDFSLSEVPQR